MFLFLTMHSAPDGKCIQILKTLEVQHFARNMSLKKQSYKPSVP